MPIYHVKCYESGRWDDQKPREVEANDAKEAAEAVCGEPLRDAGKLGQLRAQVWPQGSPGDKRLFYRTGSSA